MTLTAIEGGGNVPPEPDWTLFHNDPLEIEFAHREWTTIINELKEAQALSVANGHMIKRLVHFRLIFEQASNAIVEQGAVIKAKRTKVQTYNLWWTIVRQAHEAITTLEAELGVSPTRRGKITPLIRKNKTPRPSDKYLERAKP